MRRYGTWMLLLCSASMVAQTPSGGWTVRPEWVRAHEEFLASDVMAGRGSATRDEQLAATYVASEFIGYGLKSAPGMDAYLQSAEVEQPQLDGKATLTFGASSVSEGSGFQLLSSSGTSISGPLRKLAPADVAKAANLKGAVVWIAGRQGAAQATSARRQGAVAVLVEQSEVTDKAFAEAGNSTRTGLRLKGSPVAPRALVALSPGAAASLSTASDGTDIHLNVNLLPETVPRRTWNAIGFLPGTDRASGTILLTAHLDHLGIGPAVNGDAIYNGANDDAAGTTAVLELAHALAAGPPLRRSVLFVCFGSEESGELGSVYFGQHPPVPLQSLIANLEFEMIGAQDPKMPKDTLLLTGWERSNLGPELAAHGAKVGPDPYPEQHFFERSDNYQLALQGVVAHTAAGWGVVPTYHQPSDDLAHLNLEFMTVAIQSLVEPVRWLATSDFKPAWNPGGQPGR